MGEARAPDVIGQFLQALSFGDDTQAAAYLHEDAAIDLRFRRSIYTRDSVPELLQFLRAAGVAGNLQVLSYLSVGVDHVLDVTIDPTPSEGDGGCTFTVWFILFDELIVSVRVFRQRQQRQRKSITRVSEY